MFLTDIAKTIAQDISFLKRDVILLFKNPIEYLYSFTYSKEETVNIQKYDSSVNELGKSLVKAIKRKHPDLNVHFIGSAALKIPGQKDIDLLVESKPADFPKYLPTLISIFGTPKKHRKTFVEWELEKNNCHIDLILCEANNKIFRGPLMVFEILKHNKAYLAEYQQIKLAANHLSVREYVRRRLVFFNRLREL